MVDYDLIVVGSGAGGLAAGLEVARNRHSVLVLEAAPVFGGCLSSLVAAGYSFDMGLHYLGQLGKGHDFSKALHGLGLSDRVEFIELEPSAIDRYCFPDFELRLCRGKDPFKEQLLQLFPCEEKGINKFFRVYDRVTQATDRFMYVENRPSKVLAWMLKNPFMLKYARVPYQALLDAITPDIRLQTALAAPWFDYMLPPKRASVIYGLGTWRHYLSGAFYPRGGSGALRDAFVGELLAHGAELRCSSRVTSIDRRESTFHVTTEDGAQRTSKAVVSNADPKITLGELVRPGLLPTRLVNKAKGLRPSGSLVCVLAGTDLDLPAHDMTSGNLVHYGQYDINDIYNKIMATEFPEICNCIFINSPSVKDPTANLAPRGRHSLQIMAGANYSSFARWAHLPSRQRGGDYDYYVKELGDEMVATVERYLPQLSQHLDFVKYLTPLSFEGRINLVRGGIYGPELAPDQMGLGRFHDGTCGLEGLYLAGAGAKGGGVYYSLISGIQAGRRAVTVLD
jgi:phytoene dehydrogenase-like protein